MTDEIKEEGPITTEPENPGHDCPECEKRKEEQEASDELGMAVLIALVPALTITLFSNMGLF